MTRLGQITPERLMFELKTVVRAGCRPAKLTANVLKLSALTSFLGTTCSEDRWALAIHICRLVQEALEELGSGAYGRAARLLFGVDPKSRGLLLGRRRLEAALELQVEVATFVRHWEPSILQDLAVCLYARSIEPLERSRCSDSSASGTQ